jgi:hypothetical protein
VLRRKSQAFVSIDARLGASRNLDPRSGPRFNGRKKRTHGAIELMDPVQEKAPRKAGPRDWKRCYFGAWCESSLPTRAFRFLEIFVAILAVEH